MQDDSSTWRYFGQFDGDYYANFYTKTAGHAVVAGHPITCDRPDLHIALDDPQGKQRAFELYNPTDTLIETRLRLNPTFFPLPPRTADVSAPVKVAPFTSVRWTLDF
jgi:hypothetical protein